MAVVFIEGFDLYNGAGANTGSGTRWVSVVGGIVSMTTGRFGGQALRLSAGGVSGNAIQRATLPATYSASTVGFAFRVADLAVSRVDFMWLVLDGGVQLGLAVTTLGEIKVYRGASGWTGTTLLGASVGGVIYQNTWHYIEFINTIASGTGGAITVKVDGDTVIGPLTGINTQAQANPGANYLYFGSNQQKNVDIDDVYVVDSTTSLGEMRVETLRASADTAAADFSPNTGLTGYTQVDDTTADGEATYVQSTHVGDVSLFDLSNLSTTPTSIPAVQPVQFARKTDSATRTLYLTLKSGSTVDDGAQVFLSADYNAFRRILSVDPADSAAWTKDKVDALAAGPTVAA